MVSAGGTIKHELQEIENGLTLEDAIAKLPFCEEDYNEEVSAFEWAESAFTFMQYMETILDYVQSNHGSFEDLVAIAKHDFKNLENSDFVR